MIIFISFPNLISGNLNGKELLENLRKKTATHIKKYKTPKVFSKTVSETEKSPKKRKNHGK